MNHEPIVPVPKDAPFPDIERFSDKTYNDAHIARLLNGDHIGWLLQYELDHFVPVQWCRTGSANPDWQVSEFPGARAMVIARRPPPPLVDDTPRRETKQAVREHVESVPPGESDPLVEYSDIWLADWFTDAHRDHLRYVAAHGRWYGWNNTIWLPDETNRARELAEEAARAAAEFAASRQVPGAKSLASARSVAAILQLAGARRAFAATAEQWNPDPDLVTAATVTLNLATAKTQPPRQSDLITKSLAVDPAGECPLWLAFLERVAPGLEPYLARVAGYCLTGRTTEHALFFLHGTGQNGKGVFISTLSGIMNTYAAAAPVEIFLAKQNDSHPTELARLYGARLVTAQEAGQGRRWDEARLKSLTGGDRVTARFMRQDFFEFTPTFKLVIAANHKPHLKTVDKAIRRRLHLIPFTVTIPDHERDLDLAAKLRHEWPGILNWMWRGCDDWREIGLAPPPAVVDATSDYVEAEDSLASWLAEKCTVNQTVRDQPSTLYESWKKWCDTAGERPGSLKAFVQILEGHGFARTRTTHSRYIEGVAVNNSSQPYDGYDRL